MIVFNREFTFKVLKNIFNYEFINQNKILNFSFFGRFLKVRLSHSLFLLKKQKRAQTIAQSLTHIATSKRKLFKRTVFFSTILLNCLFSFLCDFSQKFEVTMLLIKVSVFLSIILSFRQRRNLIILTNCLFSFL